MGTRIQSAGHIAPKHYMTRAQAMKAARQLADAHRIVVEVLDADPDGVYRKRPTLVIPNGGYSSRRASHEVCIAARCPHYHHTSEQVFGYDPEAKTPYCDLVASCTELSQIVCDKTL